MPQRGTRPRRQQKRATEGRRREGNDRSRSGPDACSARLHTSNEGVPELAQAYAPGAVVVARDEEWLITQVEETLDGPALTVQGTSELVRGLDAVFYPTLEGDDLSVLDLPATLSRSGSGADRAPAALASGI